jgi:hypothetical protein
METGERGGVQLDESQLLVLRTLRRLVADVRTRSTESILAELIRECAPSLPSGLNLDPGTVGYERWRSAIEAISDLRSGVSRGFQAA